MRVNRFKIAMISAVMISAVAILAVSCSSGASEKEVAVVAIEDNAPLVATSLAKVMIVGDIVEYNGTIEPFKINNISSASPFRIEKIYVEVGDKVKKGDKIVQMEQSQYIQQELQMQNIATDLNRMEELYKVGGVSAQQLDQLRTQHDIAQKVLSHLKDNTLLRSPIDGVVTARNYDNGDLMSPTSGASGVVTIMQMNKLKVRINISEYFFADVKKGMSVGIKTDSYGDEVFKGEISLIYPYIDATTHTFAVEVIIPNGDLRLRPGMFSYVDVNFGEKSVIVVDNKSIQKQIGSNERYLFVVADGVAERKLVEIAGSYGEFVAIDSDVAEGDEIVVKGAGRLESGDKVKIVK